MKLITVLSRAPLLASQLIMPAVTSSGTGMFVIF